jgi:hypothetical protein
LEGVAIGEVEYFGEHAGFDFFHARGAVLGAEQFVESAEAAAEGGVEVVFDRVVGSAYGRGTCRAAASKCPSTCCRTAGGCGR